MRRLCWLFFAIAHAASPLAAASDDYQVDGIGRIVALSDVHGAYDAMVRTLTNAGVIDAGGAWAGGDTHLVIVGDLLDRGPESRPAMDLLMRLEGEAAAAGGRVHVLVGNHEAMNLTGDLRYVAAGEFAAFAAEETAAERDRWFDAWVKKRKAGVEPASAREDFDKAFPPGFFAHRRAFAADGEYGKWLLSKPVVVVLNGTAFVHGGLSPMVRQYGLHGINDTLMGELEAYVRTLGELEAAGILLPTDNSWEHARLVENAAGTPGMSAATVDAMRRFAKLAESDLHASDGPLWYRGNVYCGELVEQDRLDEVLASIGARRVVVGHTPTPNREVLERLDGQVLEVDTGMLGSYYGGSGHALVIEGDSLRVVAEGSAESLAVMQHPDMAGPRPAGVGDATDLEQLLSRGTLGPVATDAAGRQVLTVSSGDVAVQAVFEANGSRGNFPAVAAYRLDRLLELDMVPVTVPREVGGDTGSLQYLPPGTIDEERRTASREGGNAWCPLPDQWGAMYVFDSLIYHAGRSRQQMLYSPDEWQLLLVGNEDAFSTKKGRPRHLEKAPIVIGDAWREALLVLDEATLANELGDVLDERRRRALLARRDELLAAD